MNIYFSCAITGGRDDQHTYAALVNEMLKNGHIVPTSTLAQPGIMEKEAVVSPQEVYERDVTWVNGCDALVAEVSTPSHGVGYEIALALLLGKPVLCCYQMGKRVSKMITGNTMPNLQVSSYETIEQALEILRSFTEKP